MKNLDKLNKRVAIRVDKFSNDGYRIRKILELTYSKEIIEF